MTTFPVADGHYYGVDYGARPPHEADLRWYRNIPVPTSYMCMGTEKDFFGGYDHAAGEGYVHWADHTISPGKKLWTWGNHEFGYAWDRELTDADGPYAELMAGVFTDNQPDFGFLLPGEVRTFSQYWYPLVGTGPAHEANLDLAVHLERAGSGVRLGSGRDATVRGCHRAPHRTLTADLRAGRGPGAGAAVRGGGHRAARGHPRDRPARRCAARRCRTHQLPAAGAPPW